MSSQIGHKIVVRIQIVRNDNQDVSSTIQGQSGEPVSILRKSYQNPNVSHIHIYKQVLHASHLIARISRITHPALLLVLPILMLPTQLVQFEANNSETGSDAPNQPQKSDSLQNSQSAHNKEICNLRPVIIIPNNKRLQVAVPGIPPVNSDTFSANDTKHCIAVNVSREFTIMPGTARVVSYIRHLKSSHLLKSFKVSP